MSRNDHVLYIQQVQQILNDMTDEYQLTTNNNLQSQTQYSIHRPIHCILEDEAEQATQNDGGKRLQNLFYRFCLIGVLFFKRLVQFWPGPPLAFRRTFVDYWWDFFYRLQISSYWYTI